MGTFFNSSELIGAQRKSILNNELISFFCNKNDRFNDWIQNKFLRYEFDQIDDDDLRALEESLSKVFQEFLNDYFESNDLQSLINVLSILIRTTPVSALLVDMGVPREVLESEFSGHVEPKFSLVIKVIYALGLTLHSSIN